MISPLFGCGGRGNGGGIGAAGAPAALSAGHHSS